MQTYIDGDAFRHVARCDCGWNGVRRWSRGSAAVDAAIHDVEHVRIDNVLVCDELLEPLALKAC